MTNGRMGDPASSRTAVAPASALEDQLHDLHFRPVVPDDWRRLQRFHDRLSQQTVQLRFHGAKQHLSEPLAHRFTQVDGRANVAWVATTGTHGRIVGVARYFRIEQSCAEVAFVIEDQYQHHGVGRRLMRRLARTARENGITQFIAEVMPGNQAMLHLLQEAGAVDARLKNGVYEVHVTLSEMQECADGTSSSSDIHRPVRKGEPHETGPCPT